MDRHRTLALALLAALVLLAVGRSWWGTRLDSFTADEPWHIVAGVAHVQQGDFALNPEQTPLVKLWVAPWMGAGFQVPPTPLLQEKMEERAYVQQTMYLHNDDRAAQQRARIAMWTFHGVLLFAIGMLAWRIFGLAWAAATVGFLALEPTVGAHLPVVMTDLPAAMTLLLAALCLGLLVARRTWPYALLLGLALGLALGSKHSALGGLAGLALFGLGAAAWIGWRRSAGEGTRVFARLAVAGVLALVVLWAQYGFHFHARPDGTDPFNREMAAKIDDLRLPAWRSALHVVDDIHLLPRPYVWGLADTVRAGIEGRGYPVSMLWGRVHFGAPPWYAWPSLVASKVPLALMAMALLGLLALWRAKLPPGAGWALGAVLAMATGYAASLLNSNTTYAGLRHALPLVMLLAIVAGALAWRLAQADRRWLRAAAFAPLLVALLMTAREPRLWEYHNELAGGTSDAWRYFANESIDLGQRFHEVNEYGDHAIAKSGLPLYYDYWFMQEQADGAGLPMTRRVRSMHDDNVAGIYEGWFAAAVMLDKPMPEFDWDPAVAYKDLHLVARLGHVQLRRGRQVLPLARADSMAGVVMEYIYKERGNDWALVAQRLEEVMQVIPYQIGAGVELGNAYQRLGRREAARGAFQSVLDASGDRIDALTRGQLQQQLALLDSDVPLAQVPLLRNPMME
jgi:hypothetical protein